MCKLHRRNPRRCNEPRRLRMVAWVGSLACLLGQDYLPAYLGKHSVHTNLN